jgi:protein-tyrosine phosphatase
VGKFELSISKINSRLFVSNFGVANALVENNPHRITASLNVHQKCLEQNPDIVYMHLPFEDGEDIPDKIFTECLLWLRSMWEAGNTILINCAMGVSRSVVVTAAFMHYLGLAQFEDALQLIKEVRPIATPATKVVTSAKRMLKIWPYDGSFDCTTS